jgi:hypothetical protein
MESLYKSLLKAYEDGTYDSALENLAQLPLYEASASTSQTYVPYPGSNDPKFYEKLFAKKEFHDIVGRVPPETVNYESEVSNRCSESTFKLSPHQIFVKRFLSPQTPYNGLLLYHSVGVGKTCSAISIAEQYIGLYQKRVLVVLSSNLKDNFKKQIFDITRYNMERNVANLCTGTKYPEMVIDRKLIPREIFEKRINKIINERYQFIGYKELVNLMSKIKTRIQKSEKDASKHQKKYEDKLKELFSNRLVIIDEAHNLRMPSEMGKKLISTAFLELVQVTTNVKLLLMTATPMFNDPREIVWMMNLLLTCDNRPALKVNDLFDKNGLLTKKGSSVLTDACRGYVSFMRGENPFSFPFRLYPKDLGDKNMITEFPKYDIKGKKIASGNQIQELQLIGSELSAKQILIYEELKPEAIDEASDDDDFDEGDGTDEAEADDDKKISNDMQNMLQLCNIVFPSKTKKPFGSAGFNECFNKNKSSKGVKYEYRTKQQFLTQPALRDYAPKIDKIVDYACRAKGIVFIYSQYYYSGIIPIALALEHAGFNKLNGNIGDKLQVKQKAPLIGTKRPNYIILSRNKDLSPNNDREIALAKSAENLEGEVIKVVIVSKIGTEGLDFKRIREMHLLDPWYNMNRAEQIIGRGVRTCSHIDLPKEKRNVSIYLHAVTMPDDEEESIDLRVYRIAERKQQAIKKVEDVLKSTAVDCNFNGPNLYFPISKLKISFDIESSQGNVLKKYDVGDRTTKVVKCAYESKAAAPLKADESTYNIDLINDEIDVYKQYVISMFKTSKKKSYTELLEMLNETYKSIDENILKYTINQMVTDGAVFDGYKNKRGHLIYAGDKYVFVADSFSNDIDHKPRLPLDALARAAPKALSVHKNSVAAPTFDIIAFIEDAVAAIEKHVNKKYHKQIVDAVIDRLSTEQLVKLMEYLNRQGSSKDIETSVNESGFAIKDGGKIIAFYNHVDEYFYCLAADGTTFVKGTALDLARISKQIKEVKARLFSEHKKDVKGFVQHKNGDAKFKVRDGTSAGYVCYQTHSLQVEDLRQRILTVDASAFDATAKLSKAKLCDAYEAVLRKQGKVARPFLKEAAKKSAHS